MRRDVEYGVANGKRLLLDAYVPTDGSSRRPAVVLIHGGGFRAGDKASFEPEARKLVERKGWVAFSINYRLDETAAFPAEVEDVQAAVRWIRANARDYRVDPTRIGALGESAGAHLAAMLATLGEGDRDDGARIEAAVSWSGPMDLTALARQRGDAWGVPLMGCSLAACPDKFAQFSPITHVDGSDAPLSLINSTNELVPLAQAEAMASRIEDAQGITQVQRLDGARHALDYRDEVWNPTELFLAKFIDPPAKTSIGTVVFAVTVLVVVALAGVAVLRRQRTQVERPILRVRT
ncbi:MAG: alpha/beta hydrolase fold domain-containing protein [Acidimicrobiales bacterium]